MFLTTDEPRTLGPGPWTAWNHTRRTASRGPQADADLAAARAGRAYPLLSVCSLDVLFDFECLPWLKTPCNYIDQLAMTATVEARMGDSNGAVGQLALTIPVGEEQAARGQVFVLERLT